MTTNVLSNSKRGNGRLGTSITKSQRSSCKIMFSRWENPEIVKLEIMNAKTDPVKGGSSSQGNLDYKKKTLIVDSDVIRVQATNNKGASSGTFSITLKQGPSDLMQSKTNYLEAINPGDWVYIFLKKNGSITISNEASSGLKFVGIVDNVRFVEIDDPGRGSPRLEYVVTGRSYGKIFDMSIYFNPIIAEKTANTILGAKFFTDSFAAIQGGNGTGPQGLFSPDQMLKSLINFYFGGSLTQTSNANQIWHVPADMHQFFKPSKKSKSSPSFFDVLDMSRIGLHKFSNGKFSGAASLPGKAFIKSLPSSGNVWAVLQYLANLGINEVFVDLVNNGGKLQPGITVRQLPFSVRANDETNVYTASGRQNPGNVSESEKTYFVDLPRYVISSSDVKQKNVGKSDFERINLVTVIPRTDEQTYEVAYAAAMNTASIQRHGLKTFQVQSPYVMDGAEAFNKYCEKCVNLLTEWFFLNHVYYNGTIITDGVDEFVELGTNLYIQDTQQIFHIEGYTHTYEQSESGNISYNTEFRVSRGQKLKNAGLEFIGKVKDDITITSTGLTDIRNTRK